MGLVNKMFIPVGFFFVLSCSPPLQKLDPQGKKIYEEGYKGERDFKVLLKSPECKEEIKKRYKVKVEGKDVLVVSLSRQDLENLLKDDCVKYVSAPQRLELK